MKTTLIPISAATVCAVALVGCEWGGVHSGESWNDAYSWANFTGTYKLVNAISSEDVTTTATSTSSSSSATAEEPSKPVSWNGKYTGNGTYQTGKTHLVEKSVSVSIGSLTFSNVSGNDTMVDSDGNKVTVVRENGALSIELASESYWKSKTPTITMTASQESGSKNYTPQNEESGESGSGKVRNATPFRWLNLNQKGNLLTIEMVSGDSKSAVFTGKITGASCPKADDGGYVQAGHIRFTFEASRTTNPRQTLTGSISGDWSGSQSATTGTIANRTIDATFHDGKTATPFQAVSGNTTVYAKEISAAAGITE